MTATESFDSCASCRPGWRLPVLLGIVLLAILVASNDGVRQAFFQPPRRQPIGEAESPAASKVLLTVNLGIGQLVNESAQWREGMTVADARAWHRELGSWPRCEGCGQEFQVLVAGGR